MMYFEGKRKKSEGETEQREIEDHRMRQCNRRIKDIIFKL